MATLLILSEGRNLLNHIDTDGSISLTQLFEIPYTLQCFIYLFYCRSFLKKYNVSAKNSIAKVHPVSLQWLQQFIQTLILIILLMCIAVFVFPVVEYFLLLSSIACIIPYLYLFYKLFSSEHLFSEKEQELLSQIIIEKKQPLQKPVGEKLTVKVDKTQIFVDISNIFFIKSEEKYTRIYLKDKSYLSDFTLSELGKKYPLQLLRIHRNTLANKNLAKGIEKFKGGKLHLLMEDGNSLEVSRRMTEAVKELFA